jgi:hypothetical protein
VERVNAVLAGFFVSVLIAEKFIRSFTVELSFSVIAIIGRAIMVLESRR